MFGWVSGVVDAGVLGSGWMGMWVGVGWWVVL